MSRSSSKFSFANFDFQNSSNANANRGSHLMILIIWNIMLWWKSVRWF